uniref:Uncharacterized protein n=1 Tax=Anguilla anguilla TaxID=7936 RepID=A0A0E9UC07_ANGAN
MLAVILMDDLTPRQDPDTAIKTKRKQYV